MPQEFTLALTDEQAAQLRELAAYWRVNLEEAFRRAAVDGIDMALQIEAHDEEQANPRTRQHGPGGDLDDGIPF
jgi:hypothetical protein